MNSSSQVQLCQMGSSFGDATSFWPGSMAKQELPEDIMFHILLGLPVISLLRFKSVCKSWCAHINSSTFITQHLHHHNHCNNKNGTIIAKTFHKPELYLLSGELYEERFHLNLGPYLPLGDPFSSEESWRPFKLVASCNGIICLSCTQNVEGVALWNPATKQLTRLRSEVGPHHREYDRLCFGFGYDVKTDDYKVVIVKQFCKSQYSVEYNRAEVYSLQTDSWRTVNANIQVNFIIEYWRGAGVCNGHYYCWLLETCSGFQFINSSILYFDFRAEVFGTMPLPYLKLAGNLDRSTLTMTGDNITCIHETRNHFDIWVLKEFGVKESWTKLYTVESFRLSGKEILIPMGFLQEVGLVVMTAIKRDHSGGKWHMALCDPNTQELKYVDDRFLSFEAVAIYKESLVSIKREVHPVG